MTIKIDPIKFNENNACMSQSEWSNPRVLSPQATDELFGDDLSIVIAIRKDGTPVAFHPYGTELSSDTNQHNPTDVETLLEFSIKVPRYETAFEIRRYTVCYPLDGSAGRPCPC